MGYKERQHVLWFAQQLSRSTQVHEHPLVDYCPKQNNDLSKQQHKQQSAMAFGRSARTDHAPAPGTDYGTPVLRSNRLHRPLLAANNALHLISSVIVLGISGYFINDFTQNTHLRYWVAVVRPFLLQPVTSITTRY